MILTLNMLLLFILKTASRMESNGVPNQIHISSDMHECVKHLPLFDFECCGKKQIKGKGEMVTYIAKARDRPRFPRISYIENSISAAATDALKRNGVYVVELDQCS